VKRFATAELVRVRATVWPREFVGEVFARLVAGPPIDDDEVMALYRSYQGVVPR